ncbi:MAG: hypothetical protein HC881_00790 [Leptolyngbyaceae cyanobacterium SL_7_1]|nr:hypothetical protein [Leptolyngbyaceae cyanobacterium SL_7_1]
MIVPDPNDMSQDSQIWVAWWSPGIALAYLPALSSGLSMGTAARITSYVLTIAGSWGWLTVADLLQANLLTKLSIGLILSLYAIGNSLLSAALLEGGDILPFAVVPWLISYTICLVTLLEHSDKQFYLKLLHSLLLGLLLGAVYWLKYSAFLVSIGLFVYLCINFLRVSKTSFQQKGFLSIGCGLLFVVPPLSLTALNRLLSGSTTAIDQFTTFDFNSFGVEGWQILVTAFGAFGLALFQTSDWFRAIAESSSISSLDILRSLDPTQKREAVCLFLGIPSTAIAVGLLVYFKNFYTKQVMLLGFCITVIPLTLMLYLSITVGFNFLVDPIARYAAPFIGFVQILLLYGYFQFVRPTSQISINQTYPVRFKPKLLASIAVLIICVLPSGFIAQRFWTQYNVWRQVGTTYITTRNQLYEPALSYQNVQRVVRQIDSLISSPLDVVALYMPQHPYYAGAWLELRKNRVLPLDAFGSVGAFYNQFDKFHTSQDLQVVLVASTASVSGEADFSKLAKQFPQAISWEAIKPVKQSNVFIWLGQLDGTIDG